jgi:hypothetical protein
VKTGIQGSKKAYSYFGKTIVESESIFVFHKLASTPRTLDSASSAE